MKEAQLDGLGRVPFTRLLSDPAGTVYTRVDYDGVGRKAQEWNPSRCDLTTATPPTTCTGETTFGSTVYAYDGLNRITKVIPPDGTSTSNNVTTEYVGNRTTATDPAGKQRQSETDALGRLTKVVEDPNGLAYETGYTYDVLDNLTNVAQGVQTRTFHYDSLSRLKDATNPESGLILYTYDSNGNVLTKTDARLKVTTFDPYDELNRPTRKSYSDSTPPARYCYDGKVATDGGTCATANPAIPNAVGRVTAVQSAAPQPLRSTLPSTSSAASLPAARRWARRAMDSPTLTTSRVV